MAGFAQKPPPPVDESFPEHRKRKFVILIAAHLCFMLWEGLSKSLGVMLQAARDQFNTETWTVGTSIGLMLASRGVSGMPQEFIQSPSEWVKFHKADPRKLKFVKHNKLLYQSCS